MTRRTGSSEIDSIEPVAGTVCPECGATVPPGQACADAFQAVLSKDFSEAGFREVHHLMVPSYTLQHPSRLSRQGWLEMRKMLALFVIDGMTPVQAQRKLRLALDSGTRDFSFRKGERIRLEVVWSMTVADVRSDAAENYRDDVKAWAAAVIADTRDVHESADAAQSRAESKS